MGRLRHAARARLVHAGFGAAAITAGTAYWLAGPGLRPVVYTIVVAIPVVTFGLAMLTRHLEHRRPWGVAVVGLLLLLTSQLLAPTWIAEPHLGRAEGSLIDVAQSTAHSLFLLGTGLALRRRASADPGGITNAALFGLCAGGPLWVWVVQPTLPPDATAAGQILLLADLLVLCGVIGGLIRIGGVARPGRPTIVYLVLTAALTLAATIVAALTSGGVWVAELILGAYLTIAAAPIHPDAPTLTQPVAAGPAGRLQLSWLAAALSINPLIAAVQTVRGETSANLLLPVGTLLVIPLVLLRIRQLTTQRDRAERTLAYHATHDELTGLANRRHITAALDEALAALDRGTRTGVTVLLCDLDGFKPVNDEFGHPAGDEVLRVVGQRLTEAVRGSDRVGRLGGDEFLLVCPDLTDDEAGRLTERIAAAVRRPVATPGGTVSVGVTIGAAHARPGTAVDRDALVAAADGAMYAGKARRNRTDPVSVS